MPLPLVPIAIAAVTYGSVAYTAYRTVRKITPGRRCQKAEDGLDEGMTYRREPEQANATARLKRTFTLGENAYELDAAALGRVRFRKL